MYGDDNGIRRECYAPWLAWRRIIPGANGSPQLDMGETFGDTRLTGLSFTLPGAGIVSARADNVGRWVYAQHGTPPADDYEIDWEPTPNDKDNPASFLVACLGQFEMPDIHDTAGTGANWTEGGKLQTVRAKATSARVDFVNRFTTPDEEIVVGEYYPDDFALLERLINISFTYKHSDPALYKALFYGFDPNALRGGKQWDPITFTGKFLWRAESPVYIPGTNTRYALELRSDTVRYAVAPVALQAGRLIMLQFTGRVLRPSDPNVLPFSLSIVTDFDGSALPQVAPRAGGV